MHQEGKPERLQAYLVTPMTISKSRAPPKPFTWARLWAAAAAFSGSQDAHFPRDHTSSNRNPTVQLSYPCTCRAVGWFLLQDKTLKASRDRTSGNATEESLHFVRWFLADSFWMLWCGNWPSVARVTFEVLFPANLRFYPSGQNTVTVLASEGSQNRQNQCSLLQGSEAPALLQQNSENWEPQLSTPTSLSPCYLSYIGPPLFSAAFMVPSMLPGSWAMPHKMC